MHQHEKGPNPSTGSGFDLEFSERSKDKAACQGKEEMGDKSEDAR